MHILKLKIFHIMQQEMFNVLRDGHMVLNLGLIWRPIDNLPEKFNALTVHLLNLPSKLEINVFHWDFF